MADSVVVRLHNFDDPVVHEGASGVLTNLGRSGSEVFQGCLSQVHGLLRQIRFHFGEDRRHLGSALVVGSLSLHFGVLEFDIELGDALVPLLSLRFEPFGLFLRLRGELCVVLTGVGVRAVLLGSKCNIIVLP